MSRNSLYLIGFLTALCGCTTTSLVPPEEPFRAAGPVSAKRSEALLQTVLALGAEYRYGGDSPRTGYDCSGLVAHVFEQAWGIRLPRSAEAQSRAGTPVSPANLRPGDLVFYNTQHRPYSHVGIYIGDGRFVHAPKTGARVRIEQLRNRYWIRRFDGARRIRPPDAPQG